MEILGNRPKMLFGSSRYRYPTKTECLSGYLEAQGSYNQAKAVIINPLLTSPSSRVGEGWPEKNGEGVTGP